MPITNYSFKNKTVFITGASRGIGLSIAILLASKGFSVRIILRANIAIVAKTTTPHPSLPGTIYTAAQECVKAGGRAIGIKCDIRDSNEIQNAIEKTVEEFGGMGWLTP
jgi:citronellol/citronellal dehydrogenase